MEEDLRLVSHALAGHLIWMTVEVSDAHLAIVEDRLEELELSSSGLHHHP